MIKVCFFVVSLEQGGTETYLLRFLTHYQNKIDATIICKSGKKGILEPDFKKMNANILAIKMGYFNLLSFYKTYNLLKKNKYNSVVDLTSNFGGVYMLISRFANINKRINFYRQSSNHFKETKFKLIYNSFVKYLVYRNATSILANSEYNFKYFFPKIYKKDNRFEVIANGVKSKKYSSIPRSKNEIRNDLNILKDKFIIGHVGRYNKAKNHLTILQVASKLIKNNKNIELILCGRGTDDIEIKDELKKLGISEEVHCLGNRNDIPEILKALDFFYFPSLSEGQPNALIEAMISGLPICASDIGSIKESIPDFLNDYLVNPLDIKKSIEIILKSYNKKNFKLIEETKLWAIERYDPSRQFNKLFIKL
ncbi:MAG: glycosyltransferase [Flavobacteriaceae bacterium]|nr:glycosyltransferase [Flavobacteriaceae bacterium]